MVNYAYLRVSTNRQDVDNQRHGIFEYANQKSLGHLKFSARFLYEDSHKKAAE